MTDTIIARRTIRFRKRDGATLKDEEIIELGIGLPEPCVDATGKSAFRCIVSHGVLPVGSHAVYGSDAIHALTMALQSLATHCEMLSNLGEVRMENGALFDPAVYGMHAADKIHTHAQKMFAQMAQSGFGRLDGDGDVPNTIK